MPIKIPPCSSRDQPWATSSSPYGCSVSICSAMAEARSRNATPDSAICRTMVSWRGSNTVAARCAPSTCRRKPAYSAPQSAARRSSKSRMVVVPSTRIPLGRTRTAVTSRFLPPISMPTLEPKAANFLRSAGLWGPGILIPAQNLERDITGRHEFYGGGDGAAHVGKLTVGQPDARGGAEREDGVATYSQASQGRAAADEIGYLAGI